jgi:hypothetical protein
LPAPALTVSLPEPLKTVSFPPPVMIESLPDSWGRSVSPLTRSRPPAVMTVVVAGTCV